ncbi:MAG: mercuric reductase [Pirellulales bacterium]|nr:mercuric reductase [Pirellulales bacterium]
MNAPLSSSATADDLLAQNVHPPDWKNKTPAPRYDLLVVGGGPAGLVSAVGAAGLGARVALVEREALGGDCLNTGCVPSKALLESAWRLERDRSATVRDDIQVAFRSAMEHMRGLRAAMSHHDSVTRLTQSGVDVFFGNAEFMKTNMVEVDKKQLRFKRAIVATGASPAIPPIPGIETIPFLTSQTIFSLSSLPSRIAVIGAGPIGCELAQAFARFGSDVFLFEVADGILPREDPEAISLVKAGILRDGVHVFTGCKNIEVRGRNGKIGISCLHQSDPVDHDVDQLLVATGRTPNSDSLNLEAAQVRIGPRGHILVDDFLRTTNRRIYAAGDVCSQYQFTHAADALARIAVGNALFGLRGRASRLCIPWATYTSPEIAQIGVLPEEAVRRGWKVETYIQPFSEVDRCVIRGETDGFMKVYVRQRSDKIVGATVVGKGASELIGVLSLAMTAGVGLKQMAKTIFPYPTEGDVFRRLGDQYNRGRLSPWVKRLLAGWIAWR